MAHMPIQHHILHLAYLKSPFLIILYYASKSSLNTNTEKT